MCTLVGTTEHIPSLLGGHIKEKCFGEVAAAEEGQSTDWCVAVFPLQNGSVTLQNGRMLAEGSALVWLRCSQPSLSCVPVMQ